MLNTESTYYRCSKTNLILQKLVEVQQFLGLPELDLTSHQVKIHKGSPAEHIKNWDEVDKTLRGTIYESFLYTEY